MQIKKKLRMTNVVMEMKKRRMWAVEMESKQRESLCICFAMLTGPIDEFSFLSSLSSSNSGDTSVNTKSEENNKQQKPLTARSPESDSPGGSIVAWMWVREDMLCSNVSARERRDPLCKKLDLSFAKSEKKEECR